MTLGKRGCWQGVQSERQWTSENVADVRLENSLWFFVLDMFHVKQRQEQSVRGYENASGHTNPIYVAEVTYIKFNYEEHSKDPHAS